MIARPPPGTRAIARAVRLLTALGTRKNIGWRLTDLAAQCELDDSTTHRIMTCLTLLRLAQQRKSDRRYIPGPMLFELALSLPAYPVFQRDCHAILLQLVKVTGWNTFMYLRSGEESVCIDRIGASTLAQPLIDIGSRRLLAGSSMGIAMLLAMPKEERLAILAANRERLDQVAAHRKRGYELMWMRSMEKGMGFSLGDVLPGGGSIAVAILDTNRQPFAAIGVSGPLDAFTPDRIDAVTAMLQEEARRIEVEQTELINP